MARRAGTSFWAAMLAALALAGCSKENPPPPTCPAGQTFCGGVCVDLATNKDHCGTCDHACGAGTCSAGACACDPSPVVACSGQSPECVNPETDPANCGGCGQACTRTDEQCSGSTCQCLPPKPDLCGNACVDTATDPAHCGGCDTACTRPHEQCGSSTCQCLAPYGTDCGTYCANTQNDPANCNGCGNVCAVSGQVCATGQCTCPASKPDQCGSQCVNQSNDPQHCGTGCVACQTGATCQSGSCQCPSGQITCGATPKCVDPSTDHDNCGNCGHACGASETCAGSQCFALVCGGTGCAGGSACCGTTTQSCPLAHSNGLGQTYYDCAPLGVLTDPLSFTQVMAQEAAVAWAPTGTVGTTCGGCVGRWDATHHICASWCYSASTVSGLGLFVGSATSAAPNCTCPTSQFDANIFWH